MATQQVLIEAIMVTATVYMPVVARVRCWRFSISNFLISYFCFPNFPFLLLVTPIYKPQITAVFALLAISDHDKYTHACMRYGASAGCLDSVEWMVEWTRIVEWNVDNLEGFHLLIMTTSEQRPCLNKI